MLVRHTAGVESRDAAPRIVVAAVAIVRDGAVLTVRKRGTARFMLVGGKLEPGESPEQAALRETREEVGIEVDHAELMGEFVSETANEPGHVLHSTVFLARSEAEPVAAGEIAEVRWTPIEDPPDDLAPMLVHHVLPLLRAGARGGARVRPWAASTGRTSSHGRPSA